MSPFRWKGCGCSVYSVSRESVFGRIFLSPVLKPKGHLSRRRRSGLGDADDEGKAHLAPEERGKGKGDEDENEEECRRGKSGGWSEFSVTRGGGSLPFQRTTLSKMIRLLPVARIGHAPCAEVTQGNPFAPRVCIGRVESCSDYIPRYIHILRLRIAHVRFPSPLTRRYNAHYLIPTGFLSFVYIVAPPPPSTSTLRTIHPQQKLHR